MSQYLLAPIRAGDHPCAAWEAATPSAPVTLSARQRTILAFIEDYQQMWGETPLYREIGAATLLSVTAVQYQIARLVELGWLRKPPKLVRAIRLTAVPVKAA